MPKIPTPFIGGGEERRRDLSPERQISQPYVPGGPERTPHTEPGEARDPEAEPASAEPEATEGEQVADVDDAQEEGTTASGPAEPAPRPARRSEPDLPEFLLGPDGSDSGTKRNQEPPRDAVDDLQAAAEDLLAGQLGDRIRTLTRELAGEPPEASISRAFAAGYLAGRERE